LSIRPEELREWHGLRITTPERTWCDLASVLSVPDLVAAGDYLIHYRLPFTTADGLAGAVRSFVGRRGKPSLLAALPLLNDRSESRRESLLRVLVVTAGIQGVAANPWITTSGGYRYRGDLVIPEKKVVIEYQSRFHDGSKEFRADMTRISRLEADGWFVMQVNKDDLDDPRELAQRIRIVLRMRPLGL
jgi:very-short-patch-repair endonuclease